MTQNKRLAVNICATYGRSLLSLVCGLFTSRWVLLSLGQQDYGLYGVVGGLTAFVAFLNGLLAGAVGRFYAFSVGESRKEGYEEEGLDSCRHWFNVAVFVHTVVPFLLLVVGYPIGVWAVKDFLSIPPDRIDACLWVWRFACLSCFVGMVNVPFQAMYTAKQEIAELTIYSVAQTVVSFVFIYYMVSHPSDWLVKYALVCCIISLVPQFIITWRACVKYRECRFRWRYLVDLERMKQLGQYAGSRFICAASLMLSHQGMAVLVNKLLGAVMNTAMSLGTSVSNHSTTLSTSFANAFWPAITNAAGEGRLAYMRELIFRSCLLSTFAVLVFAIPLSLELDEVMILWLKIPPPESAPLCLCLLIVAVNDRLTDGHWMGITAMGKIAAYQLAESLGWAMAFAFAWVFILCGFGLLGVGFGLILARIYITGVKLYYGRKCCGLSVRRWFSEIVVRLLAVTVVAVSVGLIPRCFWGPSLFRVCVTTCLAEIVLLPLSWKGLLGPDERKYLVSRLPWRRK